MQTAQEPKFQDPEKEDLEDNNLPKEELLKQQKSEPTEVVRKVFDPFCFWKNS